MEILTRTVLTLLLGHLLTDFVYAAVDPRVRLE